MKKFAVKIIEKYLFRLARERLKDKKTFVIAITGSVGKTSTKEAIKVLLEDFFPGEVFSSFGNMNDEIGMPMAILGFDYLPTKTEWPRIFWEAKKKLKNNNFPKYLVLEMGVDRPGGIEYLTKIVQPDIAIVTAVAPAHLEQFKTLDAVLEEKMTLLKKLTAAGYAIFNSDDERLNKYSTGIKSKKISYGLSQEADVSAKIIKSDLSGSLVEFRSKDMKKQVKSNLIGEHLLYPLLAALSVSRALQLDFDRSVNVIKKVPTLAGRMRVIKGIKETTLIDDSYNANPSSMTAALKTLANLDHLGRKVAILGNMNELGEVSEKAHRMIARVAGRICDLLVFIGPNAKIMQESVELLKSSERTRGQKIVIFEMVSRAVISIDELIEKNDLILIKASQNKMRFEKIVEALMAEPEKASGLLVRQGRRWGIK
jgi:UDP-N-acetylmuramoyl-tripeptide--D-alanyl-D-alanine ligase